MRLFYIHTPGVMLALSIRADNEREARAKVRAMYGIARLPRGTDVWESTPCA